MADNATPSSGPTWEVTGQVETTRPQPGGTFVQGMTVSFVTAKGTVGSVFLPMGQYTPDAVRQAIANKVATLSAVDNLKG